MPENVPNSANSKATPPTPGKGFFGWLGRQVGHVTKALKVDVAPTAPRTIYRDTKVEEKTLPQDPTMKLRRTVVDEVVVTPAPKAVVQKPVNPPFDGPGGAK